jgi:hypothetical protein
MKNGELRKGQCVLTGSWRTTNFPTKWISQKGTRFILTISSCTGKGSGLQLPKWWTYNIPTVTFFLAIGTWLLVCAGANKQRWDTILYCLSIANVIWSYSSVMQYHLTKEYKGCGGISRWTFHLGTIFKECRASRTRTWDNHIQTLLLSSL